MESPYGGKIKTAVYIQGEEHVVCAQLRMSCEGMTVDQKKFGYDTPFSSYNSTEMAWAVQLKSSFACRESSGPLFPNFSL